MPRFGKYFLSKPCPAQHDRMVTLSASSNSSGPDEPGRVVVSSSSLTVPEKIRLLTGNGVWRTNEIARLGIRSVTMADGPNGIRYPRHQFNRPAGHEGRSADFLDDAVERSAASNPGVTPSTCFPTSAAMACSWDVKLAGELGTRLGREGRAFGVELVLGPGMNTRRTPLDGRTFEYYSEEPHVTAHMASAVVDGIQSQGVGACVKHFAANNSEVQRTTTDSVIAPRALWEIYLRAFGNVIRNTRPWAVMSAYNRLNGVQSAENRWLLTDVLRDSWGFGGVVISDWGAIKDRPRSLVAGNDLEMPENQGNAELLLHAVQRGDVPLESIDDAVDRLIQLSEAASTAVPLDFESFDWAANHEFTREAARSSMVLLANDGILPLAPGGTARVAVIGPAAKTPIIQGHGSAHNEPTQVDVPLDEIAAYAQQGRVSYYPGWSDDDAAAALRHEAVAGAEQSDVAIVFAHVPLNAPGENIDRTTLALADGYDRLIEELCETGVPVVVVLAVPDAVTMPWARKAAAILVPFLGGQGVGKAVADILFGHTTPSGKLVTTFPVKDEDIPGYLEYPGERGTHLYSEGIYVGYRYYDVRGVEPLFPFGHGLSYTTFRYDRLTLSAGSLKAGQTVTATVALTNIGTRDGAEIVQLYASFPDSSVKRPVRQLVGFGKVDVAAGEQASIEIQLDADEFAFFDTDRNRFVLEDGQAVIAAARSSRQIELTAELTVAGELTAPFVHADSDLSAYAANPVSYRRLREFLAEALARPADEVDTMLDQSRNSFLGVFQTLERRFGIEIAPSAIAAFVQQANLPEQERLGDTAQ